MQKSPAINKIRNGKYEKSSNELPATDNGFLNPEAGGERWEQNACSKNWIYSVRWFQGAASQKAKKPHYNCNKMIQLKKERESRTGFVVIWKRRAKGWTKPCGSGGSMSRFAYGVGSAEWVCNCIATLLNNSLWLPMWDFF